MTSPSLSPLPQTLGPRVTPPPRNVLPLRRGALVAGIPIVDKDAPLDPRQRRQPR